MIVRLKGKQGKFWERQFGSFNSMIVRLKA